MSLYLGTGTTVASSSRLARLDLDLPHRYIHVINASQTKHAYRSAVPVQQSLLTSLNEFSGLRLDFDFFKSKCIENTICGNVLLSRYSSASGDALHAHVRSSETIPT